MAERIAISPDAAVAVKEEVKPCADDWRQQRQFGMTFEEQQEVLYQTLLAYAEPDQT